jgi:hypothetical protein
MTKSTLHRVAAHVLGRRRYAVCGRFGLRATPAGFGTPAFGTDPETVRVAELCLVREVGGTESRMAIGGATIRELAAFVDADIDAAFTPGDDAPPVGDTDAPMELDPAETERIANWFSLGWRTLDAVLSERPQSTQPGQAATIQLWPEHFDAATTVTVPSGLRVNLGFSPGDSYEPEPYVYVGPWDAQRPGDASFWNAPFGAVRRAADIERSPSPLGASIEFLRAGLDTASHSTPPG